MSSPAIFPSASQGLALPPEPVVRLTVDQYHEMARAGILLDGDPIELLEGWLVRKMTKDPPHTLSVGCTADCLAQLVGSDWHVRIEGPITTAHSEPEPDISVVRGRRRDYADHHPGPDDVALVIEVADTSLARDRDWKKKIYASARIPAYWIVNLVDNCVEVYLNPSDADYSERLVFRAKDRVSVALKNQKIGAIPVDDLLP